MLLFRNPFLVVLAAVLAISHDSNALSINMAGSQQDLSASAPSLAIGEKSGASVFIRSTLGASLHLTRHGRRSMAVKRQSRSRTCKSRDSSVNATSSGDSTADGFSSAIQQTGSSVNSFDPSTNATTLAKSVSPTDLTDSSNSTMTNYSASPVPNTGTILASASGKKAAASRTDSSSANGWWKWWRNNHKVTTVKKHAVAKSNIKASNNDAASSNDGGQGRDEDNGDGDDDDNNDNDDDDDDSNSDDGSSSNDNSPTSASRSTFSTTASSARHSASTSSSSSSSSNGNVTNTSGSGNYQRVQQNRGSNFWSNNNWEFWSQSDPTHGSVSFQSEDNAKSQKLIGLKNGTAFMRTSTADLSQGQNRPSVRFQSKKAFDSGLVIFDVAKMPVGCATWPALWTTMGSTWPRNGEIDVVEGVGYTAEGQNKNQMTLHLGSNSPLQLNRRSNKRKRATTTTSSLGKIVQGATNCNQYGSHTGCAFYDSNGNGPSWGSAFNAAGGGIWAMQFGNSNGVKIWFWGRQSGKIPSELSSPSSSPAKLDPSSWGTPMANFQTSLANSAIKQQNIIMDITIGGDWAGAVPMDGQCKGKDRSSALAKGSNYQDAEFIINAIDVYCQNGQC